MKIKCPGCHGALGYYDGSTFESIVKSDAKLFRAHVVDGVLVSYSFHDYEKNDHGLRDSSAENLGPVRSAGMVEVAHNCDGEPTFDLTDLLNRAYLNRRR